MWEKERKEKAVGGNIKKEEKEKAMISELEVEKESSLHLGYKQVT